MSTRVSVTAAQKPKPKATFKFLRRDEGRLSYSAVQESPHKDDDDGLSPRSQAARRDSKSLREAIAQDMRNAKSQDPLSEIVVAVPKKPPPPAVTPGSATATPAAAPARTGTGGAAPPTRTSTTPRRTSSRAPAAAKKPEWVHPDLPEVTQEPRRAACDDDVSGGNRARGAAPRTTFAEEYDSPSRDSDGTPAPPVQRRPMNSAQSRPTNRFSDPAADALDDVYTDAVPRNYFRQAPAHRASSGQQSAPPPTRPFDTRGVGSSAEDRLMAQLEVEVYEAQQERAKYMTARSDLEREKERFENYRFNTQQQFEEERQSLDSLRHESQRSANKDVKTMEERYRNVSGLLATERETNRRLVDENDSLRTQLENLTSVMREMQVNHKGETARLRRDIDSLQKRNSELLTMAKDQQAQALDRAASVPALAIVDREKSRAATSSHQPSASRDGGEPSLARPVSKKRTPVAFPSEDEALFVAEPTNTPRAGAPVQTQVVMDFSERNKDDEAKERRVRELEQRMKREEEDMQRRRQQRALEAEERRQSDPPAEQSRPRSTSPPPSTTAAAPAVKANTTPNDAQRQTSPRIRKQPPSHGAQPSSAAAQTEEMSRERKESGHPVHTPRVSAATKRPAAGNSTTARPPIAPKAKRRIPSRSEMVADVPSKPNEELPNDRVVSENAIGDNPNKRELLYRSGKREIHYANGTVKVVLPSGHTILHFTNGDLKCSYPSGTSSYWYSGAETLHTQQANGLQIYEFKATEQTERHMPDGTKEILYPDGIFKIVHADGSEETLFPEGELSH